MALHPSLPKSPYAVLEPAHRWFPADEALRASAYEQLLAPLVAKVRTEVKAWRDADYDGASATSRALLNWWFERDHLQEPAHGEAHTFRYYFAQREAVETVIWLYDVRQARDKFDLMRFDSSGALSSSLFDEDWPRYVVKMATGAGKAKVLALLDVRLVRATGNLFLTNIHRVYLGDVREPTLEDDDQRDYFLQPFGAKPAGKTTDNKTDLGELIREIDELAVFNDEAHHIHDPRMAWFGSIRDMGAHLERIAPELQGAVLVIHTKKNGETKDAAGDVWVIETKGREELELPRKMARLAQWCGDATAASRAEGGPTYRFIYVDQAGFERHPPATLAELVIGFRQYQPVEST